MPSPTVPENSFIVDETIATLVARCEQLNRNISALKATLNEKTNAIEHKAQIDALKPTANRTRLEGDKNAQIAKLKQTCQDEVNSLLTDAFKDVFEEAIKKVDTKADPKAMVKFQRSISLVFHPDRLSHDSRFGEFVKDPDLVKRPLQMFNTFIAEHNKPKANDPTSGTEQPKQDLKIPFSVKLEKFVNYRNTHNKVPFFSLLATVIYGLAATGFFVGKVSASMFLAMPSLGVRIVRGTVGGLVNLLTDGKFKEHEKNYRTSDQGLRAAYKWFKATNFREVEEVSFFKSIPEADLVTLYNLNDEDYFQLVLQQTAAKFFALGIQVTDETLLNDFFPGMLMRQKFLWSAFAEKLSEPTPAGDSAIWNFLKKVMLVIAAPFAFLGIGVVDVANRVINLVSNIANYTLAAAFVGIMAIANTPLLVAEGSKYLYATMKNVFAKTKNFFTSSPQPQNANENTRGNNNQNNPSPENAQPSSPKLMIKWLGVSPTSSAANESYEPVGERDSGPENGDREPEFASSSRFHSPSSSVNSLDECDLEEDRTAAPGR